MRSAGHMLRAHAQTVRLTDFWSIQVAHAMLLLLQTGNQQVPVSVNTNDPTAVENSLQTAINNGNLQSALNANGERLACPLLLCGWDISSRPSTSVLYYWLAGCK